MQQRTRETREKIIRAALEVFAERGFDGARTRDIASRAGVNQGLLTYHFSSKDTLWKAAVDHIFAVLRENLGNRMEALEEVEPGTRLRLLVRHYVRFAAEHPELHRLMVQEGKVDGPRMQWLVDRHVRPLHDAAGSLIREAQTAGALPAISPFHLVYILIGAAAHLFVMAPEAKRVAGRDPLERQTVEEHAEAILSLFLDRAEAGSAPRRAATRKETAHGRPHPGPRRKRRRRRRA